MDQATMSGDDFEYVHLRDAGAASAVKENETKGAGGRRTGGSKSNVKNKSKGKSWKKSSS